jgi:hypothetical protein
MLMIILLIINAKLIISKWLAKFLFFKSFYQEIEKEILALFTSFTSAIDFDSKLLSTYKKIYCEELPKKH